MTTKMLEKTIETERAAFEEWARRQWASLCVHERAKRFECAHAYVEYRWGRGDGFGLVLLAGGLFPYHASSDERREMIRAQVVDELWCDWNQIQVVAEGLIGTDAEIGDAACDRMDDDAHMDFTASLAATEYEHPLNHVVTYHVDKALENWVSPDKLAKLADTNARRK